MNARADFIASLRRAIAPLLLCAIGIPSSQVAFHAQWWCHFTPLRR
jgi:hypothetical protein